MTFFLENSFRTGCIFGQEEDFKLTTELSQKVQYSHNQAIKKRLKWSNTAFVKKRSFTFKIKFCVFQVTKTYFCMKVIRIYNAQPVKYPF